MVLTCFYQIKTEKCGVQKYSPPWVNRTTFRCSDSCKNTTIKSHNQYTNKLSRSWTINLEATITVIYSLDMVSFAGKILLNFLMLVQYSKFLMDWIGLAPPPFTRFISQKNAGDRLTKWSVGGDSVVPRRKTSFCKTAFTVRASQFWNTLPLNIHQSDSTFAYNLNTWLKSNQTCHHTEPLRAYLVCPHLLAFCLSLRLCSCWIHPCFL